MNDNYVFGPEPDPATVKAFLLENRDNSELFSTDLSIWDAEGQTYNVTENVMAYYLMSDIKFGDFSLLAGFRHEFTSDDYNGNVLIYDTEGDFSSLTPVSDTKKYNDLFPMVHFVYDFDQFTKVRLAFTRSMSSLPGAAIPPAPFRPAGFGMATTGSSMAPRSSSAAPTRLTSV